MSKAMVTAEMTVSMLLDKDIAISTEFETIQRGEDQASVRLACEEWLCEELMGADIDFEGIDTGRTDGYEFWVQVGDETGNLIGEGKIFMEDAT